MLTLEHDEEQEPLPCLRCGGVIVTPKLHGYDTSSITEVTRMECLGCEVEQDFFGAPFDELISDDEPSS